VKFNELGKTEMNCFLTPCAHGEEIEENNDDDFTYENDIPLNKIRDNDIIGVIS
jgi:hypothetical protein